MGIARLSWQVHVATVGLRDLGVTVAGARLAQSVDHETRNLSVEVQAPCLAPETWAYVHLGNASQAAQVPTMGSRETSHMRQRRPLPRLGDVRLRKIQGEVMGNRMKTDTRRFLGIHGRIDVDHERHNVTRTYTMSPEHTVDR